MKMRAALLAAAAAVASRAAAHPQEPHHGDVFAYSQSYALDLSDDAAAAATATAEEEERGAAAPPDASDLCVDSALLYDGGCLLSSLAVIGGDIAEKSAVRRVERDESDDEDDDDNDTDGSCSMLSNASLRQSQAAAAAAATVGEGRGDARPAGKSRSSEPALAGPRAVALPLAFRGGAAAGSVRGALRPLPRASSSPARRSGVANEVLKRLLTTALVTLVFEALMGHIFEFLKIQMQTSSNSGASYADVVREITATKGVLGLWDGFLPWGAIQALSKGAVFGLAYALALRLLRPLTSAGLLSLPLACTLAGGIGGGMQGYVLSPLLLLKTRVMTNPAFRARASLLETTGQSFRIGFAVVTTEGLAALMKGSNIFALKRVLDWASRYLFADSIERLLVKVKKGEKLTVGEKSVASLLGGVASTYFTLPLDVLVAKIQDAKKAGMQVSPLVLFQDELREAGWSGLQHNYMRGFEARLLHVSLTTLVIKTWTPIVYNLLFLPKQ